MAQRKFYFPIKMVASSLERLVTALSRNNIALEEHLNTSVISADHMAMDIYDPAPSRSSESNMHGGILSLDTGSALDSAPTDITVTVGIGKLMIVVNAGSDLAGTITVTGTTVDRVSGVETGSDTDVLTIDAVTTDDSTTDANGNVVHVFTDAYYTTKWFTGTVVLSTTNLTLTDVDTYHVSFEQWNDQANFTIRTFDVNLLATHVAAEFDAYLYAVTAKGDKCTVTNLAGLHVGAVGSTALANRYYRLRRGNLNTVLEGATDGMWVDIHYANTPAYIEDMTCKVWATIP
jgi:hypothetical protein